MNLIALERVYHKFREFRDAEGTLPSSVVVGLHYEIYSSDWFEKMEELLDERCISPYFTPSWIRTILEG